MKSSFFVLCTVFTAAVLFAGCKQSASATDTGAIGGTEARLESVVLSGFKDTAAPGWLLIKGTALSAADIRAVRISCENAEFGPIKYNGEALEADCVFKNEFTPANKLTVSYKGQELSAFFTDFKIDKKGVLIKGYFDGQPEPSGEITIPSYVSSIGSEAFKDCKEITGLTVKDGVTAIGDYAFEGCEKLKKADIPATVTSVGESAFESCGKLDLFDNYVIEQVDEF